MISLLADKLPDLLPLISLLAEKLTTYTISWEFLNIECTPWQWWHYVHIK